MYDGIVNQQNTKISLIFYWKVKQSSALKMDRRFVFYMQCKTRMFRFFDQFFLIGCKIYYSNTKGMINVYLTSMQSFIKIDQIVSEDFKMWKASNGQTTEA